MGPHRGTTFAGERGVRGREGGVAGLGLGLGSQVRYFGSRAAARQATAAESQANETRRLVQLDVAAKRSSLRAAAAALESARAGNASAEETYRITSAQVSAGSASTTDLLDASSALPQARLEFARARLRPGHGLGEPLSRRRGASSGT